MENKIGKLAIVDFSTHSFDGTRLIYTEDGVRKVASGSEAKRLYKETYIQQYGSWEQIPESKRLDIAMIYLFGG